MKIGFLGNFVVDYTSESHYLKTFQKLGHEVVIFQEGKSINNDVTIDFDIFSGVHSHGSITPNLDLLLNSCKEKNIPIVGYHLDLWLGIEREKDLENDSYWRWMDYFFIRYAYGRLVKQ